MLKFNIWNIRAKENAEEDISGTFLILFFMYETN